MYKKAQAQYEKFHKGTSIQKSVIGSNNFTYRIILEVINDFLESPKRILDIGCGAGTISLYLTSKGNNVLGIDIAVNAIKSCNKSARFLSFNENATFKVMNFPSEIPNKKFDFILCSEVIEHLPNDDIALKKIFSLLNPEGIAIISTPSKNAPLYKLGLAKEFDKKVGHLRRYDLDKLVKTCRQCGFTILGTRRTEGLLRNFLFINPVAGKFVRFIKFFLSNLVSILDEAFLRFFGESQIFIILQKPI